MEFRDGLLDIERTQVLSSQPETVRFSAEPNKHDFGLSELEALTTTPPTTAELALAEAREDFLAVMP